MPIRATCSSCGTDLKVPDASIGRKVRCPRCQAVFTAEDSSRSPERENEEPPARSQDRFSERRSQEPVPRQRDDHDDEDDRRSRRRDDDRDEYDDRRSRPRRRSRADDDDEDRPRRRRQFGNESNTGYGVASLILGLFSLPGVCVCSFFGLPLAVMAIIFGILGLNTDARGQAMAGLILGIVAVVLMGVGFLLAFGPMFL